MLTGNRVSKERFEVRRIEWPSLMECELLGTAIGGSAEFSAFTPIKATATINFSGDVPDTADLLRVTYIEDSIGEPIVIGTYVPCIPETAYTTTGDGQRKSAAVSCSSVLSIAANRYIGYPLTVKAGSNAVSEASALLSELSLTVEVEGVSEYTLSSDHTFDDDETYLGAVNWLLSAAGFASASPTALGKVVFKKYAPPELSQPDYVFKSGKDSIIKREVRESSNYSESPNAVRLYYEGEECGIAAWAMYDDERRKNREQTYYETVSELSSSTISAMKSELEQKAMTMLHEKTSEILYIEIDHPIIPLSVSSAIRVEKPGKTWDASVTNMSISFGHGAVCTTKARRFIESLTGETHGSFVVWEAL